jgi:hypothetical protein
MDKGRVRVDSGLAALLGAWPILAPVVLGYGFLSSAVWDDMFVEAMGRAPGR